MLKKTKIWQGFIYVNPNTPDTQKSQTEDRQSYGNFPNPKTNYINIAQDLMYAQQKEKRVLRFATIMSSCTNHVKERLDSFSNH